MIAAAVHLPSAGLAKCAPALVHQWKQGGQRWLALGCVSGCWCVALADGVAVAAVSDAAVFVAVVAAAAAHY